MSKGIIVVDIAEKCENCVFSNPDGDYCPFHGEISYPEYASSRPDDCPIKELPARREKLRFPQEKILKELNQEKLKHWDSSERLDRDDMDGSISEISDTNDIHYCPKCGEKIYSYHSDGLAWLNVRRNGMQELEKILEEIELEKKRVSLSPDCSNEHAVIEIILLEKIEKIIRNHMNNGWIPVDNPDRKHGRWRYLTDCANQGVYCSVCHKKVYKSEYANQKIKSKYCPNCGAIMDGDFKTL